MTLAHLFNFTRHDLHLNRQGTLSTRQAQYILRQTSRDMLRAVVLCLAAFVLLALLFNSPHPDGLFWALILSGLPLVWTSVRLWSLVQDVSRGKVATIEGYAAPQRWQPPLLRPLKRLFPPGYYLSIQDTRLSVDRRIYHALEAGRYILYVTPGAHRVVSLEALADLPRKR